MNNTLKGRVWAHFGGTDDTPPSTLNTLCRQLVDEQYGSWIEFRNACNSLRSIRERDIECSGFSIRLMYNPGRSINTLAAVTPEGISERPCFLCADNLPAEQKAIMYRDDFLILANPRPILPFHLTIAHKTHRPQSVYDSIDQFLRIAMDIGPDFTTLYNGPRCGASAPDHLHFQAVPSGRLPIERELDLMDKFSVLHITNHITISSGQGLGREIILIEGSRPGDVCAAFRESIHVLRTDASHREEPMINVISHYNNNNFRLVIFPRRAHRPAAFYREDDHRIMVSPAVMEMGGIIVTPSETDFNRLDALAIESIYREVSVKL
ncbi:MAG: putative cytosolic protein [Deltaproteobacteria bacterium]|nr:putative cytosolic protein [Deltaproteobacteria bacterium]